MPLIIHCGERVPSIEVLCLKCGWDKNISTISVCPIKSNNEASAINIVRACVPKGKSVNSIKGCAFFGHRRPGRASQPFRRGLLPPHWKIFSRKLKIFRAFLPGGNSFLDTYGRRPPGVQEAFYIKSIRIGIDRGRPDRVYADDGPRPPKRPNFPFHYVSA